MRVGLGVALGGVVLAVEAGAVQVGWAWGMGQGGASREDISCEDTKPSCLTGVGARALARRGVRGRTWSWTASSVGVAPTSELRPGVPGRHASGNSVLYIFT